MIYYGHEGGDMEKDAVLAFVKALPQEKLCHHALSTPQPNQHTAFFGHGGENEKGMTMKSMN